MRAALASQVDRRHGEASRHQIARRLEIALDEVSPPAQQHHRPPGIVGDGAHGAQARLVSGDEFDCRRAGRQGVLGDGMKVHGDALERRSIVPPHPAGQAALNLLRAAS
ncbi:hypothetical protein [Aestuariivirga sp.]|uniref:hypothetical protein n=1 Tax=Aestuariivirga sp. TaxID=2650926 RepID=UPI00391D7DE0